MANKMRPIHPGEILTGELAELNLSANAFAKALGGTHQPNYRDS